MNDYQCHFGQLLKEIMKTQGLSVKNLCTKLKKHNTVVYYWLRSRHWPSDRVELVSAALGKNLYALACPAQHVPAVKVLLEENEQLKKANQRLEKLVEALSRK